ncbi:hypothetical protein pb186bvf_008743 [Paramecium bursaria]
MSYQYYIQTHILNIGYVNQSIIEIFTLTHYLSDMYFIIVDPDTNYTLSNNLVQQNTMNIEVCLMFSVINPKSSSKPFSKPKQTLNFQQFLLYARYFNDRNLFNFLLLLLKFFGNKMVCN